jgi:hypothetical protein
LLGNRGFLTLIPALDYSNIATSNGSDWLVGHSKYRNRLREDNLVGRASLDRNSLEFTIQGTNKSEGVTISTSYHVVSEDLEKGETAEGWQYGNGGSSKVRVHARRTDG